MNVTEETAELLERWVWRKGWTQGELAREALCKGLPLGWASGARVDAGVRMASGGGRCPGCGPVVSALRVYAACGGRVAGGCG